MVPYTSIPTSRAKYVSIPGEHSDLSLMSTHRPELLSSFYVPQLDFTGAEPNSEVRAIVGEVD
jgi:hypothetical protein